MQLRKIVKTKKWGNIIHHHYKLVFLTLHIVGACFRSVYVLWCCRCSLCHYSANASSQQLESGVLSTNIDLMAGGDAQRLVQSTAPQAVAKPVVEPERGRS